MVLSVSGRSIPGNTFSDNYYILYLLNRASCALLLEHCLYKFRQAYLVNRMFIILTKQNLHILLQWMFFFSGWSLFTLMAFIVGREFVMDSDGTRRKVEIVQ